MTSGITIKRIKTEIQNIHTKETHLISIYGFGSFFRCKKANDCDLVLVVDNDSPDLGKLYTELYNIFSDLGKKLSITFDLTILTEREHKRKPLIEHTMLVPISVIERNNA